MTPPMTSVVPGEPGCRFTGVMNIDLPSAVNSKRILSANFDESAILQARKGSILQMGAPAGSVPRSAGDGR